MQLNQAQCGQGTRTDCNLDRQTIVAVGRLTQLLEVVASWRALLGDWTRPRRCVRSCSPPSQGWADWRSWWPGLVEICPALRKVEQTDATIGARGSDSAGFFGPEEPPLVVHQASERGAPASQQPSWQFLHCFLYKTAVQFSVELNRLGKWC